MPTGPATSQPDPPIPLRQRRVLTQAQVERIVRAEAGVLSAYLADAV